MKSIYQVIPDVMEFLASQQEHDIPITVHYGERKEPPTLRLSKMGEHCPHHLWNSIHRPELAERLPGQAIFKFSFGHTIEAQAISLAKATGHDVCGEQDELFVDGIKGHRDCVLDGYVVDVKSCSKHMLEKFEKKTIRDDDPFGYLAQLDGYLVGSADDDLVRHKDIGFIWAIDKTIGKMVLYEHRLRSDLIHRRIASHKAVVEAAIPPRCTCGVVADGESGNLGLDVKASYSPYKFVCFPGLRAFDYVGGPRFLTKVVRQPKRRDGTPIPDITHLFHNPSRSRRQGDLPQVSGLHS